MTDETETRVGFVNEWRDLAEEEPQPAPSVPAPPLIDRYILKSLVAEGGFGQIWRAEDLTFRREVAVKIVHRQWNASSRMEGQFQLEATVTGQLQHPGIVPVHDMGRTRDGQLYYTMKLVEGLTLEDELEMLRRGIDDDGKQRRRLFAAIQDVCRIVAFAHSRGVLHLDLKPNNIILGEFGETMVLDWGLARLLTDATTGVTEAIGRAGHRGMSDVCGTPHYMSPEQFTSRQSKLGPGADIYALGVITAEIAFAEWGRDLPSLPSGQLTKAPEFIGDGLQSLFGPIGAICRKATARKPEDRYQDARELADEIDRYLAGERVLAYPDPIWMRVIRYGKKRRTLLAVATVSLLFATFAGVDAWQRAAANDLFVNTVMRRSFEEWNEQQPDAARRRLVDAAHELTTRGELEDAARLKEMADAAGRWQQFLAMVVEARLLAVDPRTRDAALARCQAARQINLEMPAGWSTAIAREKADAIRDVDALLSYLLPAADGKNIDPVEPAQEADRHYLAGWRHLLDTDWKSAADAFQATLTADRHHFWALVFLAYSKQQQGRFEEAVLFYTAAISRRPELWFLPLNRGNAERDLGRFDAAEKDYMVAASLESPVATLAYNRAILLFRQGRLLEAAVEGERAVEADPSLTLAARLLARIRHRLGQERAAEAILSSVIARNEADASALAERAIVRCRHREVELAAADADKARELDPSLAVVWLATGLVHAERQEWDKAMEAYRAGLEREPANPALLANLGEAQLRMRDFTAALATLDQALARESQEDELAAARLNHAVAAIGARQAAVALADLKATRPPLTDAEALEFGEIYASLAILAGERLSSADARMVVDLVFSLIRDLQRPRNAAFRDRLAAGPVMKSLMQNPRAASRLQPEGS